MPQTRDCDFCGSEIPPGTGTMFVRTNGTAIHYCSSKCEKNADLGREPRDVEWVQDEEAEQLRRAEEGADTADHEDVDAAGAGSDEPSDASASEDDEEPTSAQEQGGEAGESADAEAPESEAVDDDLDEEAAEQRDAEATDAEAENDEGDAVEDEDVEA